MVKFLTLVLPLALVAGIATGRPSAARIGDQSVFKIYVAAQRYDYSLPWQAAGLASGTGTGFLISEKRILTNAHLVADARFIQVQRNGDARRYNATVRFVGHDCDLAILAVDDPDFFRGAQPLELADQLPHLSDEVTVLGFPMGGNRLSVTRGVVSRLDYSTYAHSGVDQHLVVQVDAAINPGNSGGPVMQDRQVVGLAFQGLAWADNIGYAIPLPVLHHFLADTADGTYDGYPELGVGFMNMRNAAIRAHYGLDEDQSGILVTYTDPYGAAKGILSKGDVLLTVDGHPIDNAANALIDGNTFLFAELIERKQWGDTTEFTVLRDGTVRTIAVPLKNRFDPFAFRNIYDERPDTCIIGGLVFSPLSRNLLRSINRDSPNKRIRTLFYLFQYVKPDGFHEGRSALIVLSRRLAHPVNTHLDHFLYGVVNRVNGVFISDMQDLETAFDTPGTRYHVVEFIGSDDPLILDADEAEAAQETIAETYGINAHPRIEAQP